MNYGDYAYIEAFPRRDVPVLPDANIARQAQIFEVWLRPLRTPEEDTWPSASPSTSSTS